MIRAGRFEQLSLPLGAAGPRAEDPRPAADVRRLASLMRECERSLSFLERGCGLAEGEREALRRAARMLLRRLEAALEGELRDAEGEEKTGPGPGARASGG